MIGESDRQLLEGEQPEREKLLAQVDMILCCEYSVAVQRLLAQNKLAES